MTIFGKQISVAVLYAGAVSLVTAVGGAWVTVVNGWGHGDPATFIPLALGVLGTTITAGLHIWDTMPANTPVVAPPAPPAVNSHANQQG